MGKGKKGFGLITIFLAFNFLFTSIKAQPGCPNIDVGLDKTLNCTTTCATLNANVLQTGASTSYTVSSIPYTPPYPYNGGTQIMANIDDTWSSAIVLPFNFCFFGSVYSQIVVGSNGLISFDPSLAGGYCNYSFSATCPNTTLPKNAIFGPYHDIDPSVSGALYYGIQGTSPCRTFVISFYEVAMFSSTCNNLKATHQIVLYENTNVIEVYMQNKPTCPTWNSGNALVGIQNSTGTVGYTPPARNTSQWTTSNEAWRFTPSGTPNYSVAWFNGATQIGTGLSMNVCPTATTIYTGKVTYTNCDATQITLEDQVNVNVVNDLSLSASATTPSFCAGNNTNITANGATSYVWSPSTGLSSTTSATVNATPTSSTSYKVVGTLGTCVDSTIVNINVTPGPIISITTVDSILCIGNSALLTASGGTTYTWTPSSTLSSSTGSSVTATPSGSTTYTVTGTTSGCSGTASKIITVNPLPIVTIGSNTPVCSGANINLTSSGGVSYQWSGPNGYTSSDQNPTILNSTATHNGVYIVTVTSSSGCTATAQTTMVVNSTPNILVSSNTPICENVSLNLTSSGGSGYQWSGPNGFSSTNQNPVISSSSVLASGTYTVTVTGTGGCTSTAQTTVLVNPRPNATASSNSPVCENTPLNLNSSGGSGYSWSGPIAIPNSTSATPTINSPTISGSGLYTVTVTGVGGCTSSATTTVVVNPKPIVTVSPSSLQICLGRDTVLNAYGANTYFWTPTINLSNTTGLSTTVTPTSNIVYTVHGSSNGCVDSASVTITVISNPSIVVTPSSISICPGENATLVASGGINYLWSPSNSLSSSSGNQVTATPTSTTTYSVTGTTSGCSGVASVTVNVKPLPQLTYTPSNPAICIRDSLTLSVSGADTYTWSPDSSLSIISNSAVTAHPSSSTNYLLVGTLNGCKDSIQIPFVVNSLPHMCVYAEPFQGCEPLTTSFSISSISTITSYSWDLGNGTISNSPTPSATYSNAGQYPVTVSITDINGCQNVNPLLLITVYPKPIVDFTMSQQEVYIQQEVSFTSSYNQTGTQYLWDFGDGNSANENNAVVLHGFSASNIFNVVHTVVTQYGCRNSAAHEIKVIVKIDIPNIFTPNGDGYNDTFVIEGLQYLENAEIIVYNRWGRKVFQSDNYKGDWNGGDLADGIYYYVLNLPEFLNVGPFNGSVTLLR